jgi:hypothetical protein
VRAPFALGAAIVAAMALAALAIAPARPLVRAEARD